jgi:coniferyl-aldehyde dehydrogenase
MRRGIPHVVAAEGRDAEGVNRGTGLRRPGVCKYINQRPAPLVAYWYGPDDDDFRTFVRNTRSGGVARNDFAAQMIPSAAPFGGVGRSGMGAYHGKAGFDTFSHYRTVVGNDLPFSITGTAAPPFGTSLRLGANVALRVARLRTRRQLKRGADFA